MKKKTPLSFILLLATTVVGCIILSFSCDRKSQTGGNVILRNERFTITADSLIEDSVFAAVSPQGDRIETNITMSRLQQLYGAVDTARVKFVHGRPWRRSNSDAHATPEYSSDQPLVDALYAMSMDHIRTGLDRSGRFIVSESNYSRLYCTIYLSLAALYPRESMATLRAIVDRDSIIMQREGQWPVVSDHIGWATAAWEVYKCTGDREWLAYCHRVVEKTLKIDNAVLRDHTTGLIHGAGYTTSRPLGARRMTWMGYNDLFACMSLGNNILTGNAYALLADMCDELGIDNAYQREAKDIKDAINQHLWNEDRGMYSSFLYGMAFPRQSPLADNTAQAMCVLWGIADDDRAENLISQTPVSDVGVNVNYPPANIIEPYFTNSSWATTQALWNLAAVEVGNESALIRGLAALFRAQALYQSREIHIVDIPTDMLGTSASNASMILRVLMGVNVKPEGIEFTPMVPQGMGGKRKFTGWTYRNAVFDIIVEGEGNDVESITDNGTRLESTFIPNDIEGKHEIVIRLKRGKYPNQRVTIHRNEAILPPTPVITWSHDTGHIVDYVAGTPYRLSANGQLSVLNDSVFVLPPTDEFTEYSVEIAGKYLNGFMSRPYINLTPTPQMAFIPDSVSGHTSVAVSVARGGDYLMDVGYRPTGTLDVRRLSANGHPMGTLVMTNHVVSTELNGLAYSNMVRVKLLKGENIIRFDQIRLPKTFTPCEAVHVRIISL